MRSAATANLGRAEIKDHENWGDKRTEQGRYDASKRQLSVSQCNKRFERHSYINLPTVQGQRAQNG